MDLFEVERKNVLTILRLYYEKDKSYIIYLFIRDRLRNAKENGYLDSLVQSIEEDIDNDESIDDDIKTDMKAYLKNKAGKI